MSGRLSGIVCPGGRHLWEDDMDTDKLRVPDYEGMISQACRWCAGVCATNNGRKTWPTCFADLNRADCGGPYSMDAFLALDDKTA